MCYSLKQTILKAHGRDSDSMAELILRFSPLIWKYKRYLGYDEAETDLVIALMEMIYHLSPSAIEHSGEGQLVKLIQTTIRNRAIDLHRSQAFRARETALPEDYEPADPYPYFETIYFHDMLKDLTPRQRRIVEYKILHDFSDTEIGEILHISRQAVNRLYRRALAQLREDMKKRK